MKKNELHKWIGSDIDAIGIKFLELLENVKDIDLAKLNYLDSGTTVFAMKLRAKAVNDKQEEEILPAVLIAADGRAVSDKIESDKTKKIYQIDNFLCVGIAGVLPFVQRAVKVLKLRIAHIRDTGSFLSLRSKIQILENISSSLMQWPCGFLAAGYEEREDRPRIFKVMPGTALDIGDCGGIGSGFPTLDGHLKQLVKKDEALSEEQIKELLKELFSLVFGTDPFSGGSLRAYLITINGAKEVHFNDV